MQDLTRRDKIALALLQGWAAAGHYTPLIGEDRLDNLIQRAYKIADRILVLSERR